MINQIGRYQRHSCTTWSRQCLTRYTQFWPITAAGSATRHATETARRRNTYVICSVCAVMGTVSNTGWRSQGTLGPTVQVERMNRTIKEATVKRYYYNSHSRLKAHLHSFLMAYNFARRLKTLKGLTPYEYICKIWTIEPERFIVNPFHHTVGLNT